VLDGCANATPGCDPSLDRAGSCATESRAGRVPLAALPLQRAIGLVYRGAYTVWIEWLNVTGGADDRDRVRLSDPELVRSGYARVIMSCQVVGVTY
jgi:hypothetical protein